MTPRPSRGGEGVGSKWQLRTRKQHYIIVTLAVMKNNYYLCSPYMIVNQMFNY